MRTQAPTRTSPSVEDIGDLYGALARRLEDIVRLDVSGSDSVVEDACQFAWARLLRNRERVRRETVLAWLMTTAVREAVKVVGHQHRHLSLDDAVVAGGRVEAGQRCADPEELALQHERLRAVAELPRRQQEMLWLHALGLSYAEIALHTGSTRRTVERQLTRAKHAVRASAGEAPVSATRAARPAAVRRAQSALAT